MPFSLVIPHPKNLSVKDIIIKELSVSKGLSISKLLNAVKNNNKNVTYHAVYQAVHELKSQKVLTQTAMDFSISKVYIDELNHFTRILEENYSESVNLNLAPNTTKHLTFDSLNEATIFMSKAAYSNIFGAIKNKTAYLVFQHLWLIQTVKSVRYLQVAKMLAKLNKWFILVQGNSLVDRKCKESYEKLLNAKIKLGVKSAPFGNIIVFGDIIIESFIPKQLMKLTEKVYNSATDTFDLDWIEYYTKLCYTDKYKITATITRNQEMADKMVETIMEHFKD